MAFNLFEKIKSFGQSLFGRKEEEPSGVGIRETLRYFPEALKETVAEPFKRVGDFLFRDKSESFNLITTPSGAKKLEPARPTAKEVVRELPSAAKEVSTKILKSVGKFVVDTFPTIPETYRKMQEGKPIFTAYKEVWEEAREEEKATARAVKEAYQAAEARGASDAELARIGSQSPVFQRIMSMTVAFSCGMKMLPNQKMLSEPAGEYIKRAIPNLENFVKVNPGVKQAKDLLTILKHTQKTAYIDVDLEQEILRQIMAAGAKRLPLPIAEAGKETVAGIIKSLADAKAITPVLSEQIAKSAGAIGKAIESLGKTVAIELAKPALPETVTPEIPIKKAEPTLLVPAEKPVMPLKPKEPIEVPEDRFEAYLKKEFAKPQKSDIERRIEEAEGEILGEFEAAEAGARVPIKEMGPEGIPEVTGIIRQPSTFPQWIPEHLRQKPILEAVSNHLSNKTQPSKNFVRQRELYDLVKDRVFERVGIPKENIEAVLKYLDARPSKLSPKAVTPSADKYAFNVNVERLKITKEGKGALEETVKKIKPELEIIKGKPLSSKEVLEEANKSAILSSALTREQQKEQVVAAYNLRKKVANLSSAIGEKGAVASKKLWQEYLKALKDVSAKATESGRMLQSFSINAGDETLRDNLIKDIFKKTGVTIDEILAKARTVDFDNKIEAFRFYREFVKPNTKSLLDEYRYTNMLSNPRTNLVNALSGLLQPPVVIGTKLYSGLIDKVANFLTGRERDHYVGEITPYIKGYLNTISEAYENMRLAFAGEKMVVEPRVKGVDVFNVPAIVKGIGWKLKFLTRAMEASDMFFHTLLKGAEKEALAYRYTQMGKEVIPEEIDKIADSEALYLIFRGYGGRLESGKQGAVLNTIDRFTSSLYALGKKVPAIRWFVPFIQTPTEVAKQGIELSLAGVADIPGAEDKITKLARTMVGLTVMAGAACFALDDRLSWAVPGGKKEREYFYASGKKPYSVKVGDNWVSYNKVGPIAYPLAWVAAVKHYNEEKGIDDKQLEVLGKATLGMGRFFSDQTYMQGIGDLLKTVTGNEWEREYYAKRAITNVPRQLIPYGSFQGWVARILDDTYRDADTAWEVVKTQLPFLSKTVKPYVTPTGEPSKRKYPTFNAISPVSVSPEDPFYNRLYESYVEGLKERREEKEEKEKGFEYLYKAEAKEGKFDYLYK